METRIFSVTVQVTDHDSDLIPQVPTIIRARFEGTAIHILDIDTDVTISNHCESTWYGPEAPGRDYEIRKAMAEVAEYALPNSQE